jgi:hypothetical protein
MRLAALACTSMLLTPWALGCGGNVVTGTGGTGGTSSKSASSASSTSSSAGTGGAGLDGGAVGAPCASAGSCATPEICVTSVPGGYCTVVIAECSGDPFAPGLCPAGAWCVNGSELGGQGGDLCMAKCAGSADCRQAEGYTCCPWGDAGVCFYGQGCP